MKRDDLSDDAFENLVSDISAILVEKGMKATTMDSIASSLKISKRTLYEIFNSKEEMVRHAVLFIHNRIYQDAVNLQQNIPNVMEAILSGFLISRESVSYVDSDFFLDMDTMFPETKKIIDSLLEYHINHYVGLLEKGAREGYFRKDLNFDTQCRMMWITMEALKRSEKKFPYNITLRDIYDIAHINFLRAITTSKGADMLEKTIAEIHSKDKAGSPSKAI